MGKPGKWFRSFLTGKKEKEKLDSNNQISSSPIHEINPNSIPSNPTTTPKEKRRWSFRRCSATPPLDSKSVEPPVTPPPPPALEIENEQKKQAMDMVAATAAAADAAVATAQVAAAVIRLTAATRGRTTAIEEAAAIKIQSFFRAYLARKALCALRGLVKLQALVRGHLVRKQATATLRCMQALVTLQARARAQRIRMVEESTHRKCIQDNGYGHVYHQEIDRGMEENIRIVEMDIGESKACLKSSRNSYSNNSGIEKTEHRFSTHCTPNHVYTKQENYQLSPAPSAITDMSPKTCSGHFEDYYCFTTAQSSPGQFDSSSISKPDQSKLANFPFPKPDYPEPAGSYLFPNYMANTESSRAKARSQSAPKQRPPDSFERQPSRRRMSTEGRNIPRAMRMQRSSSHVGATAQNYQYPWSIKLDRSSVSLKESEYCGSTSTVLTNTNYCRSLVAYHPDGDHRY